MFRQLGAASLCFAALTTVSATARAQAAVLTPQMHTRIAAIEPKLVAWRRDIHQHPELGNREVRTARIVADHLRSLGMAVQSGVAHTGVVGLLKGGKPGPVVLLRADMDGLPVTERVKLPFASTVKTTYNGAEVGVMHACGHGAPMTTGSPSRESRRTVDTRGAESTRSSSRPTSSLPFRPSSAGR